MCVLARVLPNWHKPLLGTELGIESSWNFKFCRSAVPQSSLAAEQGNGPVLLRSSDVFLCVTWFSCAVAWHKAAQLAATEPRSKGNDTSSLVSLQASVALLACHMACNRLCKLEKANLLAALRTRQHTHSLGAPVQADRFDARAPGKPTGR